MGRGRALAEMLAALTLIAAAAAPRPAAAGASARPEDSFLKRPNGEYLNFYLQTPKSAQPCRSKGDPMYRAAAIVTGTDMRQRPWGFAKTLREVLVKASGDPRLVDDPRIAPLAARAHRFVACYDYVDLMADVPVHDDQGTYDRPYRLTVEFDPAKINALLARFGDRPWRGARPVILPVLLVRGPMPPPYVLSAEIPRGAAQRGSFANAARQFGMASRMPASAELKLWGISAGHFPTAPVPIGSNGDFVVIGVLEWRASLPGWVGTWHTRWRGADYAWQISGVNYDAAFRDIVRGAMLIAAGHGAPH
jgi:hypothetical protein